MIKLLIVDDHDIVRAGVGRLLGDVSGIDVVGQASSGEEAIQMSKSLKPHVVLMDVKITAKYGGLGVLAITDIGVPRHITGQ